ncbi:MAG: signal peptidase I [Clostridiales bacterium]|jgi:signal peptidase I|nr:signal peptidase I [Clostridiales bacterium]
MQVGLDFDFEGESNKPSIKRILLEVFIWVAQIAAVIFLAYIIVYYCVEKTNVIGSSMESTLAANDPIIINKFAYRISDPKRFDVIVFKQSGKEHSFYNIKRIIGLPGETVLIKDGNIYINGEMIEEYSIVEPMINYGLAGEEISLEDNEYFVLGDNRNNSEDSRFASIGNITRDEIIGKAAIRLSPFNFISKLNLKGQED